MSQRREGVRTTIRLAAIARKPRKNMRFSVGIGALAATDRAGIGIERRADGAAPAAREDPLAGSRWGEFPILTAGCFTCAETTARGSRGGSGATDVRNEFSRLVTCPRCESPVS
jgi:hypothetical protein